jgi:hypothetical protein
MNIEILKYLFINRYAFSFSWGSGGGICFNWSSFCFSWSGIFFNWGGIYFSWGGLCFSWSGIFFSWGGTYFSWGSFRFSCSGVSLWCVSSFRLSFLIISSWSFSLLCILGIGISGFFCWALWGLWLFFIFLSVSFLILSFFSFFIILYFFSLILGGFICFLLILGFRWWTCIFSSTWEFDGGSGNLFLNDFSFLLFFSGLYGSSWCTWWNNVWVMNGNLVSIDRFDSSTDLIRDSWFSLIVLWSLLLNNWLS